MKHKYGEEERTVQQLELPDKKGGEKQELQASFLDPKGLVRWTFLSCTDDERVDTNTSYLMTQEISSLRR